MFSVIAALFAVYAQHVKKVCGFYFCALCNVKEEYGSATGLMEVDLSKKFKWDLT